MAALGLNVMNYGDGIYGGMFVSCMYAEAFLEDDPRKIVQAGVACLPPASPYAQLINDVLAWSAEHPEDWIRTWDLIAGKWDKREPCPNGALRAFNIDAKLNGAYIALGLLYGDRDFERTLRISTRAGQDSDCNPSNACGILGVMLGYRGIPERWTSGIPAISDRKFSYTDFTFPGIVESTRKRAIAMAEKNGGRVEGDRLIVRRQQAEPAELQVWDDYGSPVERIPVADSRWNWRGSWQAHLITDRRGTEWAGRLASSKGAEATISFEGTGAIVTGPYLPAGGSAEVYLDGELHKRVDVYPDEDNRKYGDSVWHGPRERFTHRSRGRAGRALRGIARKRRGSGEPRRLPLVENVHACARPTERAAIEKGNRFEESEPLDSGRGAGAVISHGSRQCERK